MILPGKDADFRMDFYNPDGSYGALCGNGARCAAQAAKDFGVVTSDTHRFEVLGVTNSAELLGDQLVRVRFQDPVDIKLSFKLRIGKNIFITTSYVDLGSQHLVTFFSEIRNLEANATIEHFPIDQYGPRLRWHPDLAPKGANANFIEAQSDADGPYLRIRTFERGVEGETLACGTGCMSAAIIASVLSHISTMPVRLKTQSGEFVKVAFDVADRKISNLTLEGSANRGRTGLLQFDPEQNTLDLVWDA
jgi:diaminopimelate epimerase